MLFFWSSLVLEQKNCTSADMMTLKEPVLLLRSENMVTLYIVDMSSVRVFSVSLKVLADAVRATSSAYM